MSLLSPLLLSLLPSPLTHLLLPYLSTYLPALFPPAQKGSAGYTRNYRWAITGVIGVYLAYSFVKDGGSVSSQEGEEDWYALLRVGRAAGDDELKRAFRGLSKSYHPDRLPRGANGQAAADHFILIRRAYEGLSDPLKRWAYDRFGPDILHWKSITAREYMRQGLGLSCGFYVVSGGIMLLLAGRGHNEVPTRGNKLNYVVLGRAREGAFWRNLLFFLLLLSELQLLLSPSPSSSTAHSLRRLLPGTTLSRSILGDQPPFLQIRLLHRIFTALSVGITQLAGVWSSASDEREVGVAHVLRAVKGLEVEAISAFQETVVPLLQVSDPALAEQAIKRGMEDVLLDRAISTHPQIRPVWLDALARIQQEIHTRQRSVVEDEQAPPPYAPYPSVPERMTGGRGEKHGQFTEALNLAREVALPESPPNSPLLRPIQ